MKIRLTRPLLGKIRHRLLPRAGQKAKVIRRLALTRAGGVELDHAHWLWALHRAAQDLHLDVAISSIYPGEGIPRPSITLYTRRYRGQQDDASAAEQEEEFESVRAGTVLTFELVLDDAAREGEPPPPTVEQLKALLSHIGEFFGISQWGNRIGAGYGRFIVEGITPV